MAIKRIAILGGGMSALTAAHQLTSLPGWQDRYQITLYQQGWRLGGKGASGRSSDPSHRIEEHGLHLLFGFYENAFKVLRDCYRLETNDPDAWRSAFKPVVGSIAMPVESNGQLSAWTQPCATNDLVPGEGPDPTLSPWGYVRALLAWLESSVSHPRARSLADERLRGDLPAIEAHVRELRRSRTAAAVNEYPHAAWLLADAMPERPSEQKAEDRDSIRYLGETFVHHLVSAVVPGRVRIMADFGYTLVKGLTADLVVKQKSWFDLDEEDLRGWLSRHGAAAETCASPLVQSLYACAFAGGRTMGAGTIMQSMLRAVFTFKGGFIYKMQGGMGDVVFAPLYRVLRDRITFKFFHRVDELQLSDDAKRVQRILLTEQAAMRDGQYRPLIDGDRHWPNEPLWDQLQGDRQELARHDFESGWDDLRGRSVTLEAGRDFDLVVLGISVGALAGICKDMMYDSRNPRFQWMVRGISTVQTQSAQVWFSNTDDLGWPGTVVIPYDEPFDTAAEMNQLLPAESWNGRVRSLAYLCSPLPDLETPPPPSDHGYPARQRERVDANLNIWLNTLAGQLWPNARDPRNPNGVAPSNVFARYVNAPSNLSDRYVLATQNSNQYRLRADESGYDNLILTGDWIRTALSVGCLEAATMAGIQAARAIDGSVPKAIGDWLPDPPQRTARRLVAAEARAGTEYIFRDGDIVSKPPITLDLFVYLFLIEADYRQLTRVCNSQLNLGGSTVYKPLGPFTVLYCSHLNNIVEPFGSADELDFGIWIPVAAGTEQNGRFSADRILTFTPYIWVNSGLALVGGRSVYGFPKQMGDLSMPLENQDDQPASMKLSATVLPTWASQAAAQPIWEAARVPPAARGPLTPTATSWLDLISGLAPIMTRLLTEGQSTLSWSEVARLLVNPGNPMVFLKQLPDESAGRTAAYRAIVEAPVAFAPDRVKAGPLPGSYQIKIYSYASHQIVDTLGLAAQPAEPGALVVEPQIAGWARFNAVIGPGTIIS